MDEKPLVTWFPEDMEMALKVCRSRFAREDQLPAAEERQTFGSQKPSLKEETR
jgi:hypothetical protein